MQIPEFVIDPATGKITGYKTQEGGADSVFPFSDNVIKAYRVTLNVPDVWGVTFPATQTIDGKTYKFLGLTGISVDYYTVSSKRRVTITLSNTTFKPYITDAVTDWGGSATAIYVLSSFNVQYIN